MTDEIYAPSPDGHEGTRAFVASCLAAIHDRHNEGPFCDTLVERFDGRLFGENGGLVDRPLMPIGGRIVERTGDAHARPV